MSNNEHFSGLALFGDFQTHHPSQLREILVPRLLEFTDKRPLIFKATMELGKSNRHSTS